MKGELVPTAELVDPPRATRMISPGDTTAATAEGAAQAAIDARIAEARRNLTARFSELERRVDFVKDKVDPRGWVENPWARAGIAAAIGFAIGRSAMLRPIARAALGTVLTTLLQQAVSRIDV